jgi:hypothetical protein
METRNYKFKLHGSGDWRDEDRSLKSSLCWAIAGETYNNGRVTYKVVEVSPNVNSDGDEYYHCPDCDLDPLVCRDYPVCNHKKGSVVYRKVK